jgi:rSAM/selenodomain-associated transferase 1
LYQLIDSGTRLSVDERSCAFVLMAKAPRVGAVKTRLAPLLSAEEAAELSRSFIRDMSANIAGLIGARPDLGVVAFAPAGDEAAFAGLLPNNFTLLAQRGADLGERLLHVAEDLLAAGVGAVCMINSDSPTLPAAFLRESAARLRMPGDRVVLGGADDGGYYLIGLKQPHRHLFRRIDWSTERVFAQSLERAGEIGLEVALLPPWYDVDDSASLQRLWRELVGSHHPSGEPRAPGYSAHHTVDALRSLVDRNRGLRVLLADPPPAQHLA